MITEVNVYANNYDHNLLRTFRSEGDILVVRQPSGALIIKLPDVQDPWAVFMPDTWSWYRKESTTEEKTNGAA